VVVGAAGAVVISTTEAGAVGAGRRREPAAELRPP